MQQNQCFLVMAMDVDNPNHNTCFYNGLRCFQLTGPLNKRLWARKEFGVELVLTKLLFSLESKQE